MWYKLTKEQILDFELRCCYQGMIWTGTNRYLGDGLNLLNVITGIKTPISSITIDNFSTNKYPLFGSKNGLLNKTEGYVTEFNKFYEGVDGFWYCKALEDLQIPEKIKDIDLHGNKITIPELNVPYSSFYDGCIYEGTTENPPEFIIGDE